MIVSLEDTIKFCPNKRMKVWVMIKKNVKTVQPAEENDPSYSLIHSFTSNSVTP